MSKMRETYKKRKNREKKGRQIMKLFKSVQKYLQSIEHFLYIHFFEFFSIRAKYVA